MFDAFSHLRIAILYVINLLSRIGYSGPDLPHLRVINNPMNSNNSNASPLGHKRADDNKPNNPNRSKPNTPNKLSRNHSVAVNEPSEPNLNNESTVTNDPNSNILKIFEIALENKSKQLRVFNRR